LGSWQPEIADRARITTPLLTGITAVDALVPIGRGQSLVVCGERGTGKTTTALDVLVSQKTTGVAGVYVALGKTEEEVISHFVFNCLLPTPLLPLAQLLLFPGPFTDHCVVRSCYCFFFLFFPDILYSFGLRSRKLFASSKLGARVTV
jgi:hypothetical protein